MCSRISSEYLNFFSNNVIFHGFTKRGLCEKVPHQASPHDMRLFLGAVLLILSFVFDFTFCVLKFYRVKKGMMISFLIFISF